MRRRHRPPLRRSTSHRQGILTSLLRPWPLAATRREGRSRRPQSLRPDHQSEQTAHYRGSVDWDQASETVPAAADAAATAAARETTAFLWQLFNSAVLPCLPALRCCQLRCSVCVSYSPSSGWFQPGLPVLPNATLGSRPP